MVGPEDEATARPTLIERLAIGYVVAAEYWGPLGLYERVRRRPVGSVWGSRVDAYVLAGLALLTVLAWGASVGRVWAWFGAIVGLWLVFELGGRVLGPVVVRPGRETLSASRSLLLALVNFAEVGVAFGIVYYLIDSEFMGFASSGRTSGPAFASGGSAAFASLGEQFGRQLDAAPVTIAAGVAVLAHAAMWVLVLVVAIGSFVNRLANVQPKR